MGSIRPHTYHRLLHQRDTYALAQAGCSFSLQQLGISRVGGGQVEMDARASAERFWTIAPMERSPTSKILAMGRTTSGSGHSRKCATVLDLVAHVTNKVGMKVSERCPMPFYLA